jgi:hypothetical protein
MSKIDLGPAQTHIILPYQFSATRIMDTHITPCIINLEMLILSGHDKEASANHASIGFTKILAWMDIALNDVIMVGHDSTFDHIMMEEADNAIMLTPGEPNDMIVSLLLLSKLRVISEGFITIASLTLTSNDSQSIKRYVAGEITDLLPDIKYLGEPAIHDKPWWERATIETVDFAKADHDDDESASYFQELVTRDPLKEIETSLLNREADVIKMDTWKPAK